MVTWEAEMWSQSDDSKIDVFPLVHITFLIKMKKRQELNSKIVKKKKNRAYITLEMCLRTQSDIEVQLAIKLNAILDKLTIL